jgi:hypothetical protein
MAGSVKAVLIGGLMDGYEMDVLSPAPPSLIVPSLPMGAGECRWDGLLPPPVWNDHDDPLSVPVPDLLEYRRLPDSPSGRVRYRFHR